MSDTEATEFEPPQKSAEHLRAEVRANLWADSLGRPANQAEFDVKFLEYLEEEERDTAMKTRASAQREMKKRGEEAKKKKTLAAPMTSTARPPTAGETEMDIEIFPAAPLLPTSSASSSRVQGPERKAAKITVETIIDPDSGKDAPDPKRSNMPLDKSIKRICLKSIFEMFGWLLDEACGMIPDGDCRFNLNVSNSLVSVIFTTHNVLRQKQNTTMPTNMQKKSAATDFPITFKGNTYTLSRERAEHRWLEILGNNGLRYDVEKDSEKNWIGTMGPYLNMLGCWGLRLQELRVGHTKMPVARDGDKMSVVPIERYGLSPAHSVHLEGITYPPERRASMSMSLGALTTVLCMLRTKGKYRNKWANAVKKTLSHIPAIEDFISLTETNSAAEYVKPALALLGDILLVTTSRQSQRGCIPMVMLHHLYNIESPENRVIFLDSLDLSGKGLFYSYKMLQKSKQKFNLEMDGTEEQAAQITFHTIFGTFKEDLGVLQAITNVGTWNTRQELGKAFAKSKETVRSFNLPQLKYYSKLCSANQSEFHTSNVGQVSSVPCFSGSRRVVFGDDFYDHMQRDKSHTQTAKTMTNIVHIWANYVTEVITKVQKNGVNAYGTKAWYDIKTLELQEDGEETDIVVEATGKFFLSRS